MCRVAPQIEVACRHDAEGAAEVTRRGAPWPRVRACEVRRLLGLAAGGSSVHVPTEDMYISSVGPPKQCLVMFCVACSHDNQTTRERKDAGRCTQLAPSHDPTIRPVNEIMRCIERIQNVEACKFASLPRNTKLQHRVCLERDVCISV